MRKQQQEFAKKRQEEMEKRQAQMVAHRAEQESVNKIRRGMQKLGFATIETYEELKAELEQIMQEELGKCGANKDKMQTECQQSFEATLKRVETLKEQQRRMDEAKAAENERRKEARKRAEELLVELNSLIDDADTASKAVSSKAEPLLADADMQVDEIHAAMAGVEQAVEEWNAKMKLCKTSC